ncbi:MAG: TraR/DksA family transcriptional regulator [Saprospiraceae bacterium]|jgi:RNA polymerase-binding transcription factor DksA|nr:TraR/DksA family transcriptional regulator [Saprospiraceae bacterium]
MSENNPKVRYSDEELLEFKALIDDKLEKATQQLDFMREQIVELNETSGDQQGGDWFDDSSIHTELEMLNNQVIRQQQFISNLNNALIRIQNKTYGICSVTGQLIEKARLLVVPHATKSVAAKEEKPQPLTPIMPKEEIAEELKSKLQDVSSKPKIVTKVIKKTSKNASAKAKIKEDDFDDLGLDLDDEIALDDTDDYDSLNMNFDDIADSDSERD